jgi:hypothetical protein
LDVLELIEVARAVGSITLVSSPIWSDRRVADIYGD